MHLLLYKIRINPYQNDTYTMKNHTVLPLLLLLAGSFCADAQIVNIPDANFKYWLVNAPCADLNGYYVADSDADTNNDGEIQVTEAAAVFGISVTQREIYSMSGIEAFPNLKWLDISHNNISSLPVETMPELTSLDCSFNGLTILNVPLLAHLKYLNCCYNSLGSLDLHNCTQLESLDCSFNELSVLEVQGLHRLKSLACAWNAMNSLNLQGLDSLTVLNCRTNQLKTLDLQGLSSLQRLRCWENQLTTLDLQDAHDLVELNCENNQLATLYLKNGNPQPMGVFYIAGNPLVYICCDESLIWYVQQKVTEFGLMDCSINSFCNYLVGSTADHTLQGEVRTDFDLNGCDAGDPVFPSLIFRISDGIGSGVLMANPSGYYKTGLNPGDYTIEPVLEDTGYFSVSPGVLQLNFPVGPTAIFQDFCVAPIGVHHDIEVTLLPTSPARPGFEASYHIIYRNRGTQAESGSLFFFFDQNRMTFTDVSVTPAAILPDNLRWDFTDLPPFGFAGIEIRFMINSPSQTPPVNAGDIFSLAAYATISSEEQTPENNISQIRQIIVGSYDPNDKTCLEGPQITPEMVGDYLHYLIRFENTGTFAAENIVVKDVIDVSRFDLSTLRLVAASHDCITRINGNQAEFIFENIQLPFTEPAKHGFVVFKIKTRPELALNEQLKNTASIYFDYNLPVITNTATTTVSNLVGTHTPDRPLLFSIFPNPVTDMLYLDSERKFEKAEVYDALGRIVLSTGLQNGQINVAHLTPGSYSMKAYRKDGFATAKFIKR